MDFALPDRLAVVALVYGSKLNMMTPVSVDSSSTAFSADEVEFARRCQLMADADGRCMLDDLSVQLDRLGSHIADVADALTMTAMRIRSTMVQVGGVNA